MIKIINFILIIFIISLFVSPANFAKENNPAVERFQVASGAFSDEFYEAALSLFKRFLVDFPKHKLTPQAKIYIAKCLYYQKKYSESLAELNELKKQDYPDLKNQINYWLSKIFFKKKDFSTSLECLKKITKDKQSSYYLKAKYLEALIYLQNNETKKAVLSLEKILNEASEQKFKDRVYKNLLQIYNKENNYYKINTLASEYMKNNPKTRIKDQIYFYLADIQRKQNYIKESMRNYKQALVITDNPQLRDLIYQGLGLAYLKQEDIALAKRTIDKIISDELRIYSQGLYYFNINDYIQALESFSIYLKKYPEGKFLAKVYLKKADIFYEMGRINDSLSVYNEILRKFSDSKYTQMKNKAHYGLAWCYLKNSEFKKAIQEFKKASEYSNDPAVKISSQIQMADAYQESRKYQQALDIYNQILNDYPNTLYADYIQFQIGMIFIKKKMLEEAFLSFRNLTENFPNSKLIPEAKYYLAVGYFSQNSYHKAKETLDSLMQQYPNSEIIPEAHYLYAKTFFNQQEYLPALDNFQQITTKYKNSPISELACFDLGLTYLNLNEFSKAKKIYLKFLKSYPNSEYTNSVNFYLGGIYEKEAAFNKAQKYYTEIVKNSEDTLTKQEALLSLGHLAWNQKNIAKAKKYFKKGSEGKTSFSLKSKLYLAKIYQQNQEPKKALQLYQELVNSDSKIANVALVDKAFLLKDLKQYQKAIEAFKKTIKAGIASAPIRFTLGLCLEKKKLKQEAIEQYFKLIYAYPDTGKINDGPNYKVKAYFRIAKIYESQDNLEQAKKAYRKIINLGVKESKIAKKRLEKIKNN